MKTICAFFFTGWLIFEIALCFASACLLLFPLTENQNWQNILQGVFSSLLLAILLRLYSLSVDYKKFKYLHGKFYRISFHNKNAASILDEKPYKSIYPYYNGIKRAIYFQYRGSGTFEGKAEYKEGEVQFEISLDHATPSIGQGSYNYITDQKGDSRGLQNLDFGKYSTFKYRLNMDYVVLHHQNIAPSSVTEGYEVLVSYRTYERVIRKVKQAIKRQRQLKLKLSDSHSYSHENQFLLINPSKYIH